jgi:hypothetical protein
VLHIQQGFQQGAYNSKGVSTGCLTFNRDFNTVLPGFPLARGSAWAGGRDHTPSRVPQRWDTTSCRETAPLTPHAQPGTPAVGHHQLSRDSSTNTTRPAGYPSGGAPPAVERQLHLHHTPSRVPQRWDTTSCRETAPLTPHAQPGTPAVGHHQLSKGSSTYTTRPARYPSGGAPPAVERQLHLLTYGP